MYASVQIGDKVVVDVAPKFNGAPNYWSKDMDRYIGKPLTIKAIYIEYLKEGPHVTVTMRGQPYLYEINWFRPATPVEITPSPRGSVVL